jgi:hypothetical protein
MLNAVYVTWCYVLLQYRFSLIEGSGPGLKLFSKEVDNCVPGISYCILGSSSWRICWCVAGILLCFWSVFWTCFLEISWHYLNTEKISINYCNISKGCAGNGEKWRDCVWENRWWTPFPELSGINVEIINVPLYSVYSAAWKWTLYEAMKLLLR